LIWYLKTLAMMFYLASVGHHAQLGCLPKAYMHRVR